jgi:hypothetical protein
LSVFGDKLLKTRFINRHDASVEPLDLFLIDVNASDIDTKLGKTGSGYKSYVTGTNNSDMHWGFLTIKTLRVTRVNSRDPQGQFWVTAALGTSATVFLLKTRNEVTGELTWSG